ncbi:MAG: calcium-binding protein [Bauldia sp.]|nr:calcium-binding protein [Bauldia sp.]
MAIFKASLRVKANAFQKFDVLFDGKVSSSHDAEGFTLTSGKAKLKVSGTGFEYLGAFGQGDPVVGTINKVKVFVSGDLVYTVKGLSLSIAQVTNFKTLDDGLDQALATIFGGADTIKGSLANDTLRGFAGNDVIKGRAGNDKLQGDEGSDTLNGGRGTDQYIFKDGLGNGVDTITKFQPGEKILLDHLVFADIGIKGPLDPGFFHEGTEATTANEHIIYDPDTGALSYDDGVGGADPQQFAKLPVGTHLDASSIFVI